MAASFTKAELDALKQLQLKEYAAIPIVYSEEINKIFLDTMPRLIELATEHAELKARVAELESRPKDPRLDTAIILKSMLSVEDKQLAALENHCRILRNQHNRKKMMIEEPTTPVEPAAETAPVAVPVAVPQKVSWFRKIYPF